MKLYTEEQLHKLIIRYRQNLTEFSLNKPTIQHLIDELTPIELPSDEEIGKLRDEHIPIDEEDMWSERLYFTLGAKSMRNKIQGGDK